MEWGCFPPGRLPWRSGITETPFIGFGSWLCDPLSPERVCHVCTVLAGPNKGRSQANTGLLAFPTEARGYAHQLRMRAGSQPLGTEALFKQTGAQPLLVPETPEGAAHNSTQSIPTARPFTAAKTLLYFSVSHLASILRVGLYLTLALTYLLAPGLSDVRICTCDRDTPLTKLPYHLPAVDVPINLRCFCPCFSSTFFLPRPGNVSLCV